MRERSNRPRSTIATFLAVALALSSAPDCLAQADPDDLARRHFESGAAYFEQAEYEAALREFQKAYELSQRPQILRNISVVEERLGNIAGAVAALDQYLKVAPDDPDVETIRIRRDNLKRRLEEEKPAEPTPPPPEPVEERKQPQPPPPERGPEPDDDAALAEDEEAGPNLVPAYVLITIGGLAAAGSAVTGYFAYDEHQALADGCGARSGCSDQDTQTGENLAITSTVLTGAAVLGIGIGAILWATADGEGSTTGSALPQVTVGLGARGGLAQARWRY